ncbi:hypothetical protein WICMUC_005650 [Wickerhamomyces mucosus]|uniref:Major facilitator superfamily (MFS) profile domain-containing protein n=1 Tax=Wickerhamomyces mucosus TaxID=1378264 RepID=A0A9P8P6U4_9ASCO|nr:hypothetical protein WICMUC_005650 [Wickerhamomyces mucosus]
MVEFVENELNSIKDPESYEKSEFISETTTLNNDQDEAAKFLKHTHVSLNEDISSYTPELSRKIDIRIMFVMCGAYFLQFLDKNLLNYAGVMGIKKKLTTNEFANLGTIFYVAYIVAEPVSSYCLQRLPMAKFLSVCLICWGIVVALHSACETYASLMVIRTLLGIFESPLSPGFVVISSMYWTKDESLKRTGIWVAMAGLSVILGGILSFGFLHVSTGFANWKILFLFMGILTFLFGIATLWILPDNSTKATFLTEDEKIIVLNHIKSNQTGLENKKFKKDQIKELLFKDKHTWPIFFFTLISMISTGALGTWSVSIIQSFGYSNEISTLLQMPVGASMMIIIITESFICAKYGYLTLVFFVVQSLSVIGYIILITSSNKVAKLIAIYLNMGSTSVISLLYSWNNSNTSGHTKKLWRNGLTMVAFSIGSLIGPQLFKHGEKTANITLLCTSVACLPIILLIGSISRYENNKRDEEGHDLDYEFKDLTDVENKNFRYRY